MSQIMSTEYQQSAPSCITDGDAEEQIDLSVLMWPFFKCQLRNFQHPFPSPAMAACLVGREKGVQGGETRLCHKKAAACWGKLQHQPWAGGSAHPRLALFLWGGPWSDFAARFPPFEQPQQQRWWRGLWLCCEMLVCHLALARGVYRM